MTELEEKLQNLYKDMNDLLRFAEAKNIGLIAFNVGVIIGMTKLITDYNPLWEISWFYVFWYVLVMNLISVYFAFISVVPQIKHKESELAVYNTDNLLFFGQIASMKPSDFLKNFSEKYKLESKNHSYETDLVRQIIIVAQIAFRKMKFFRIAIYCTIAGIITPIGLLIYFISFNHNK